ncbi:MAG: M23 family metallopeptidase [Nanoarchaeota archaeon]|nr:M23 family metallopeptidase [Nanoarchaeota archaeon]MBU1322093.1 M23 family metallopeptidase [Nanoarchaeota archaeon]MBU1597911.1 M23 family metallopeptidase [Nanoarchaeota archaeon]MBU2442063.1 M23 family metallopeptidase [Nanoarchaeota archaeon]
MKIKSRSLRKNKKAQVYPIFVLLFTIITLSYALIALSNAKNIKDFNGEEQFLGEKQMSVFSALQDADAIHLFLDQSSKLSSQTALDKIRQSCFVGVAEEEVVDEWASPCGKFVYPLWSTNDTLCFPDCETAFLNAFQDDFVARTKNYYQLTGINLPISYNLSIKKFEDHFLLYGISDTDSDFNVLSIEARKKDPLAIMPTFEGGKLSWPVQTAQKMIHSCFGWRDMGGNIGSTDHPGIDITASKGTNVIAAASGKVTAVDKCWGRVVIYHGSGLSTEYLHLDTWNVEPDQQVERGQKIGTVGGRGKDKSGYCRPDVYGAHLHFAVLYKGVPTGLKYGSQKMVLHSFGSTDHIHPECLLEKADSISGSGCNQPINTELNTVCNKYDLPDAFLNTPVIPSDSNQGSDSDITGAVTETYFEPDTIGPDSKTKETVGFGTYNFKPAFTTRVNKKMDDPIKQLTDWFDKTWNACTDDPRTCLNEKMKEFNDQPDKYDFTLSFADQCEDYPLFYDMMEAFEDCFSNQKYKCGCEFNLSNVVSGNDLNIMFNTEENTASLVIKRSDGSFETIDRHEFYFGKIVPPSSYKSYLLRLKFLDTGSLNTAELIQMKEFGELDGAITWDNYKVIKLTKLTTAKEGFFVNTDVAQCVYNKDKFRLCAKPDENKTELMKMKFSFQMKDKPPEPVKQGEITLVETEVGTSPSDLNKVLELAGLINPLLGYIASASSILEALDETQSRKFEVVVEVPKDKDGNPLDVAGYEVHCTDFLTNMIPTDILDKSNPSQFVVMANSGINQKVSQLDQYVNTNPYSKFLDLKDCNVPVSKFSGETVMVPAIKGVVKDGKMVFNLKKCGELSIIIDKVLRKNYCVALVPVDKNGNKMLANAISNCVQTNSLLDLVVSELLEKELGSFLPAGIIPDDLKPYIELPDTDDFVNAVTGNGDFNDMVKLNVDALGGDLKNYFESFIVDTINEDIIGNSLVDSVEDLSIWERQTVMNHLSGQIKNQDANFIFNNIMAGEDLTTATKQMAMQKGIDYVDSSKAPEILKEVAKGQDPESLAYGKLIQAAENELTADQKKKDLLEIANSRNGQEIRDMLVEKAVEKGCVDSYGISAEQAVACLRNDEIEDVYHDALNSFETAESAKEQLLNKAVDKFDENAPEILKEVASTRDFKGAAYDMLQKELNELPDSMKNQYVHDILEGRLPDTSQLQSEMLRMIPAIDNEYVNALMRDGNIKGLLESKLKSFLEQHLNSFLSVDCNDLIKKD